MKADSLPFARGTTYFQGGTTDSTSGDHLEGQEYIVPDTIRDTGAFVRLRCVRNSGAVALEGKRLVTFKAGTNRREVDGYADTTAEHAFPVDEAYTSTVAVNDLFYIVVGGPCLCLTDLAGGANNVIDEGDFVAALTAATSGATTAGRVRENDFAGSTAPLAGNILNTVGRALSAKTTANTNADVLVDVRWYH